MELDEIRMLNQNVEHIAGVSKVVSKLGKNTAQKRAINLLVTNMLVLGSVRVHKFKGKLPSIYNIAKVSAAMLDKVIDILYEENLIDGEDIIDQRFYRGGCIITPTNDLLIRFESGIVDECTKCFEKTRREIPEKYYIVEKEEEENNKILNKMLTAELPNPHAGLSLIKKAPKSDVDKLKSKLKNAKDIYYVYQCEVEGVVRYIGKGKGDRSYHCISGKSSCAELNRDFHEGKDMVVTKLFKNISEFNAIEIESQLIAKYKETLYNKTLGKERKLPNSIVKSKTVKIIGEGMDDKVVTTLMTKNEWMNENIVLELYGTLSMLGLDIFLVEGIYGKCLVIDNERHNPMARSEYRVGCFVDGIEWD
jgi:hypothetical protein